MYSRPLDASVRGDPGAGAGVGAGGTGAVQSVGQVHVAARERPAAGVLAANLAQSTPGTPAANSAAASSARIIKISLSGSNLEKMDYLSGKSDPFVVVSREDATDEDAFVEVCRTEHARRTTNPRFKPLEIDLYALCNGDVQKKLRFEFFDFDPYVANGPGIAPAPDSLIGSFTTTF